MADPVSFPGLPRWLRHVLLVLAVAIFVVVAGAIAFSHWAASLPPLNLDAVKERSTVVLDRDGKLLRAYTTPSGRWRLPVGVGDVDPRYLEFLIAYEDHRFRRHGGVDPLALVRAGWQMATRGRIVSGGSTLTMQVARLIEPRDERNLAAKLRQIVRARELERRLSKDEILGLYLSLAPFGGNIEGARAASFAYFGKEPKRLSTAEAALLVALPQSPETRRPDRHVEAARRARERVLARAEARGLILPAESRHARADRVPDSRKPYPQVAAHAADMVVKADPAARLHRLAIDGRLQAALEQLARERAERIGPKVSAAILVVDNATGEVRAHVGGAEFLSADRAGAVDLAFALRSPGSALKPFIYALAFENGIAHPETVLIDRPTRFAGYAPENFDQTFQGNVTARKALQFSLNVPAIELLAELGPQRLVSRFHGAGATLVMPRDSAPGLAIGLGGAGIRLVDLARLYRALARGGASAPLVWRLGEIGEDNSRPLTDPVSAWYVHDILKGAPPPDDAPAGRLAFKTGTSYGYRDAWAIGFDKRFTIAVWVGRPDGSSVPGLIGRQVAAPILFDSWSRLGHEPETLPKPRGTLTALSSGALPPPLRHVRKDVPKTMAATLTPPLRIAFPADGARVDLGLRRGGDAQPLAVKVTGGVTPLRWLVNGKPIEAPEQRRLAEWMPDGAGFATVSVIDATGASDTVSVRLE